MKIIYWIKQLTLLIFLCLSFPSSAQSTIEKLEGVKTSLEIYSENKLLNDEEQYLVERAVSRHRESEDRSYGFAYQGLHLEFVSNKNIETKFIKNRGIGKSTFYELDIIHADGSSYNNIRLPTWHVQVLSGKKEGKDIYTISINLIYIPLTMLKESTRINVRRVQEK